MKSGEIGGQCDSDGNWELIRFEESGSDLRNLINSQFPIPIRVTLSPNFPLRSA